MPKFKFTAEDRNGKRIVGLREFVDEGALRMWLQKNDLRPLEISGYSPSIVLGIQRILGRISFGRAQAVEFLTLLKKSIQGGADLKHAIQSVRMAMEPPVWMASPVWRDLENHVNGDVLLWEALALHPKVFPSALVWSSRGFEIQKKLLESIDFLIQGILREQRIKRIQVLGILTTSITFGLLLAHLSMRPLASLWTALALALWGFVGLERWTLGTPSFWNRFFWNHRMHRALRFYHDSRKAGAPDAEAWDAVQQHAELRGAVSLYRQLQQGGKEVLKSPFDGLIQHTFYALPVPAFSDLSESLWRGLWVKITMAAVLVAVGLSVWLSL